MLRISDGIPLSKCGSGLYLAVDSTTGVTPTDMTFIYRSLDLRWWIADSTRPVEVSPRGNIMAIPLGGTIQFREGMPQSGYCLIARPRGPMKIPLVEQQLYQIECAPGFFSTTILRRCSDHSYRTTPKVSFIYLTFRTQEEAQGLLGLLSRGKSNLLLEAL